MKKDPFIFSYGSLQLTFTLIRKRNPALALQVRNLLWSTPSANSCQQSKSRHSDCFRVTLDSYQVREVIEALVDCGDDINDVGAELLAHALLDDWIALADVMLKNGRVSR